MGKNNVGGIDRLFRLAVGFMSLAMFFVVEPPLLKIILGAVAVAGLLTAAAGYCPISHMLKIDTTQKK